MRPTIIVKNRAHLDQLIAQEMKTQGPSCDLNHIDISAVTDLNVFEAAAHIYPDNLPRTAKYSRPLASPSSFHRLSLAN